MSLILSTILAVAVGAPNAPGLWIARSADSFEPLRPVTSTIVVAPGGRARGAVNAAGRIVPRGPVPIPRLGKGKVNRELRVMLTKARVEVSPDTRFRFIFDSRSSVWKFGSEPAAHPSDFVLVKLEEDDRYRRASLDENGMFAGEVWSDFTIEQTSPIEFEVRLPAKVTPGHYAFVYSAGGPPKTGARVFDFSVK